MLVFHPASPGESSPDRRDGLPAGIVIAGAHGGAGTSTLAVLLRARLDHADPPVQVLELPACPDGKPEEIASRSHVAAWTAGRPLILTARGNGHGTRRAEIAVTVLEILGVRPAALAVVADMPGPVPVMAGQRLAKLQAEHRVPVVVRVPFTTGLRAGGDPASLQVPKQLSKAITLLASAAVLVQDGGRR